jgi:predicted aldo/keto reductase-like oxidoreductase
MPRSILVFKLPQEQDDFEIASKAVDYYNTIYDVQEHIRNKLKYAELTEAEEKIYEEIQSLISDQIHERGIKGYYNS